jgi:hypothetical protein
VVTSGETVTIDAEVEDPHADSSRSGGRVVVTA